MRQRFRTYTAYSIGTAILWGVVLLVAWLIDPSSTLHTFWLVSLGFFLGWLGSVTSRRKEDPAKAAGMDVRSLTGFGAEKATDH